jgi:hypothetical protein
VSNSYISHKVFSLKFWDGELIFSFTSKSGINVHAQYSHIIHNNNLTGFYAWEIVSVTLKVVFQNGREG